MNLLAVIPIYYINPYTTYTHTTHICSNTYVYMCVYKCIHTHMTHSVTLKIFSSVTQSCPTLWDPMDRSTPGLPVHHQLPELTQILVHRVSDAI